MGRASGSRAAVSALGCLLPLHIGALNTDTLEVALAPDKSPLCAYKCKHYFAGASPQSTLICQKQASGVGTPTENAENGVACFPPYGCGTDMITCINNAMAEDTMLPDTLDPQVMEAACEEISSLVAENPWQCAEDNSCQHGTPTPTGGWLKANADLGCGWGSTYGGVYPGYDGDSTPATEIFENVVDVKECCKKAMQFEGASWDEGGAALFFQYGVEGAQKCRVDREKIIYGNLDSSSGRSVRYQTTRCGDSDFYYRHAAGAADAANLHTGGRCVKEGNFTRLNLVSGDANLPRGELPYGQELPNHACDPNSPECDRTLMFNTINDAEDCCEMCRNLTWLGHPDVGGDATRDATTGHHVNPCVAWQIVEGRCRIVRRAYFEEWNPGETIERALFDSDYEPPGNTGWVVPTRGCGTNAEWCNYYSFIYYRELGTPENATGVDSSYSTILPIVPPSGGCFEVNFTAFPKLSRHDGRQRFQNSSNSSNSSMMNGTDCGQVFVYDDSSTYSVGGVTVFEEGASAPVCASDCLFAGMTAQLYCCPELAARRLQGGAAGSVTIAFSSVGSGYNTVDFDLMISADVSEAPPAGDTPTPSPSPGSPTPAPSPPSGSGGETTTDAAADRTPTAAKGLLLLAVLFGARPCA